MKRTEQLRGILLDKNNSDGITEKDMALQVGLRKQNVAKVLHRMYGAFIDRWVWEKQARNYTMVPVWCMVAVPDNCPKPDKHNP